MDIRLALRDIFGRYRQLPTLFRVGLIACVPIIGQMMLAAYALRFIRAAALNETTVSSDLRLDVQTLYVGLKCQLVTIVATIAASLLTLPLWALDRPEGGDSSEPLAPTTALIDAFNSPTSMITAGLAAVFSALCLARYATTGSALSALDIAGTWAYPRAEPALWISVSIVGFVLSQAPSSVVLLLPLSTEDQLPALLAATAVFWPVMLLIQAHLIGQAFAWSTRTIASRRPLIVHVRW